MNKFILLPLLLLPVAASHGANAIYRNAVMANSPIAYYEFDEASGTTAADTTATFNGSYSGSIGFGSASAAANLGSAVDFTGGWVDVPSLGSFAQSSIEAWIQMDAATTACCTSILSSNTWNTGALHLNLTSLAGNNSLIEHAVNGDALQSVRTTVGLTVGTWYHLVVTNDIAADQTIIYLNGAAVTDDGDHSTQVNAIGFGPGASQIGAWAGGRLFDGRMDEFAIYDSVLTPADVANHFNAASIPEPSGAALLLIGGSLALVRRRRS